jgi:hypothetical protein
MLLSLRTAMLLPVVALVGCGASGGQAPQPRSRPALAGHVLVVLERQDMRFGRHDTLTVGADGRANLVLAHGGGGFRNASCVFSAAELHALRRDLARLPLGTAPRPRRHGKRPHYDGVIIPRPPLFSITYRGRRDTFSGDAIPSGGGPLAGHIARVLDAREARCRVTFHRP